MWPHSQLCAAQLYLFVWSDHCDHAFNAVKSLLCNAPMLAAPNFSLSFKLEVYASAFGAGAVLLQEDERGVCHPVCYFAAKFKPNELNYSTIEKETLDLQHFEVYADSNHQPLVVYTDCVYNHNQRLMHWALLLQERNLEIRHKLGAHNKVVDALSRE